MNNELWWVDCHGKTHITDDSFLWLGNRVGVLRNWMFGTVIVHPWQWRGWDNLLPWFCFGPLAFRLGNQ